MFANEGRNEEGGGGGKARRKKKIELREDGEGGT